MSSFNAQPVQGMADLAPPESLVWQDIETRSRQVFERYGFEEIRTPLVERAELFERSLGDGSDVVQKEMYVFGDRGGRRLALRPEGTAGVLRHVAGLGQEGLRSRLYYMGPMFRAERPQAGRRRQFHQIGAEALGAPCPAADAECMALQADLLAAWGLHDCRMVMNTRGAAGETEAVAKGLRAALAGQDGLLCEDCRARRERNVMRVLDCKQPACRKLAKELPAITDFMCESTRDYYANTRRLLARLDVEAEAAPRLVRGLDYYEHTVWETNHPALGAQDALAGGGRYRVVLGGRSIEGVGFAIGMERVIAALQKQKATGGQARVVARGPIWIVTQGGNAFEENLGLAVQLRRKGWPCGMDLRGRSVKAQLRAAQRAGARWVVLRGDRELEEELCALRDMAEGKQRDCSMSGLLKFFEEAYSMPKGSL